MTSLLLFIGYEGLAHDIRRKLIHHQVFTVLKFIASKIERKF